MCGGAPGRHRAEGAEGASVTAETEGRVYNVGGQDWDEVVAAADEAGDHPGEERLVVNMDRSIRPRTACCG